jgi:hypothetical protein
MKSFPGKCGECGERAAQPVVLKIYETELDEET